jgi:hypothetical protein
MPCREMDAVYCENYTERKYTVGTKCSAFRVKRGGFRRLSKQQILCRDCQFRSVKAGPVAV